MAADYTDHGLPQAPRRGRRLSRRAKVAALAVVVVAALIAGLVVWSPWQPNPPADVHATSPTATSALVSWHASTGDIVGPSGYQVLRVDTLTSPGPSWGAVVAGYQWTDTWNAEPACSPGNCTMTLAFTVLPSDKYSVPAVSMKLGQSGTGYSGTAESQATSCTGADPIQQTDTITLTLTPVKGKIQNGKWDSWTGTMALSAPYVQQGNYHCPAANWTFALTSGLSRSPG